MENILEFIGRHEGFRSKPYRCTAGKLTIGFGRNLDDVGITKEEAEYLLLKDIEKAEKGLYEIFNRSFFKSLPGERRHVLIDMMFNLGQTRFSKFKNMIEAVKNMQFGLAADEMEDSQWYNQVGNRAKELVRIMREGRFLTTEEINSL